MLKIEFDPANTALAAAIGAALVQYAGKGAPETEYLTFPKKDAPAPDECETTAADALAADGAADAEAYEAMQAAAAESVDESDATAAATYGAQEASSDTRVDEYGVPFDKDYCSKAAEPFYKSGPNKGQWKKKKGVDDSAYNEWHAANMPDTPAPASNTPEPQTDGTASAATFGAQTDGTASAAAFGAQTAPVGNAPADVPGLMKWIAEQKQAGNLEDARVQAAWGEAGTNIGAVFQMSPEDQAAVVRTVYGVLTA